MKMLPLGYWTTVFWAVFIAQGAVSGQVEKVFGRLGGTVSFGPTKLNPPVTSIIWKQKNINNIVTKAIEWDDDGIAIPNERFKGITDLNKVTGNITIRDLNFKHDGLYTIDINSKEQEQKFNLEVKAEVLKPEIKTEEIKVNPNAVYLICEYNETIIWKNSAGETLKGSPHSPKGEFIAVEKKGKPENYYTCTLENAVSRKTSDPVYERDLFKDSQPWWIIFIIVPILMVLTGPIVLYKVSDSFRERVKKHYEDEPRIVAVLDGLDCKKKENKNPEEGAASTNGTRMEEDDISEPLNAVKAGSDGGSKDDKL
ncbi:uncharacterized protein [Garra rufa]|uniref:uncharacterized protein n=1 Tax=Garra rufa TaxID=137080 RepID=UPI003CCEB050